MIAKPAIGQNCPIHTVIDWAKGDDYSCEVKYMVVEHGVQIVDIKHFKKGDCK